VIRKDGRLESCDAGKLAAGRLAVASSGTGGQRSEVRDRPFDRLRDRSEDCLII